MYQTKIEAVPKLESLLEYQFNDKNLGWEALQCKGAGGYAQGNKRIALIGDAYLKLKFLSIWYPTGECVRKYSPSPFLPHN